MSKRRAASTLFAFESGAMAGIVALAFSFFVRLGGIAPFAPETAIESFIGVVPSFIQEPMVQSFGGAAILLGLFVSCIIAIIAYGAFGILFENLYSPWISKKTRRLTRTEQFLIYSVFPWLFFGVIVFPLSGASLFGIGTAANNPYDIVLFPIVLLVSQLVFSLVLVSSYNSAGLLKTSRPASISAPPSPQTNASPEQQQEREGREIISPERRTFIEKGVIIAAGAILAATALGSLLSSAGAQPSSGTTGASPYELQDAPQIFDDPRLASLVDSEITPNGDFYEVSIDLFDPSIDSTTWKLHVTGSSSGKTYTLSDLEQLPSVSQYTTFECVSNEVNGNLISNAKWSGVKISDLLSDAGVSTSGAQYVVFSSIDGYSVGIPVQTALRDDSILAYQMNDASLPKRHGYPLRAVIPGLYGMMSAKWITKIQVIDSSYSGYWQSRGWTSNATVNTLAFIVIPSDGSSVNLSQYNGSVMIGGYAFAGDRGISKVEVSFDGGKTWQEATLKPPISDLTWRLWAYNWYPAATGRYQIYARATDGQDQLQTATQTDTFPNGATGYAVITVNVQS